LHFPGLAEDGARLLVERGIAGVGLDTPSIDHGPSQDFIAHRVLMGADVYALENLADLSAIPPRGATVYALPMKIGGGSGAPVRVLALLP
jgi:kynurenine formamidase